MTIRIRNVDSVRHELALKHEAGRVSEHIHPRRGAERTVELRDACFAADEDAIFGEPAGEFSRREIAWYMSQSESIDAMPGKVPEKWQQAAGADGRVNSNYGRRIWHEQYGCQYQSALRALLDDPRTRQAYMAYAGHDCHAEAVENGKSDFVCTLGVQVQLSEGSTEWQHYLDMSVYMRSSDAVLGYKNDLAWHKHVLDRMCADYRAQAAWPVKVVCPGTITWHAGSLHVYEEHWPLMDDYLRAEEAKGS